MDLSQLPETVTRDIIVSLTRLWNRGTILDHCLDGWLFKNNYYSKEEEKGGKETVTHVRNGEIVLYTHKDILKRSFVLPRLDSLSCTGANAFFIAHPGESGWKRICLKEYESVTLALGRAYDMLYREGYIPSISDRARSIVAAFKDMAPEIASQIKFAENESFHQFSILLEIGNEVLFGLEGYNEIDDSACGLFNITTVLYTNTLKFTRNRLYCTNPDLPADETETEWGQVHTLLASELTKSLERDEQENNLNVDWLGIRYFDASIRNVASRYLGMHRVPHKCVP